MTTGWAVEVTMRKSGRRESRWFAVRTQTPLEAEREILRFPGILESDEVAVRRRLSANEIQSLSLQQGAVRPLLMHHQDSISRNA